MVDCARHFTLTHDLYSYASVAQDEKAPNVVHALQALAGQSPESAKASVRQAIWDTERQIYDRYADLVAQYDDSDVLVRYSQRLIIALAGNVFYSATSPRYGQYVEGAQVPENQDFFDEL